MSAAASRPMRLTLADAQRIVNDDNADPILWAAANTIISLTQACSTKEYIIDELTAECEEKRRMLDELHGVVR